MVVSSVPHCVVERRKGPLQGQCLSVLGRGQAMGMCVRAVLHDEWRETEMKVLNKYG